MTGTNPTNRSFRHHEYQRLSSITNTGACHPEPPEGQRRISADPNHQRMIEKSYEGLPAEVDFAPRFLPGQVPPSPSANLSRRRPSPADCAANTQGDTSPSIFARRIPATARGNAKSRAWFAAASAPHKRRGPRSLVDRPASSWRNKNGEHVLISSGSGSRFSGGRHFTTLQM